VSNAFVCGVFQFPSPENAEKRDKIEGGKTVFDFFTKIDKNQKRFAFERLARHGFLLCFGSPSLRNNKKTRQNQKQRKNWHFKFCRLSYTYVTYKLQSCRTPVTG
jgi:hypothetical protein